MAYFEKTNVTDEVGLIINPATEESSSDSTSLLRRMLNVLLAPVGYDKSLQRYRQTAVVESGTITTVSTVTAVTTVTTVTTVGTVGTVTGITNFGTYQATQQVYGANMSAWKVCVRDRIT